VALTLLVSVALAVSGTPPAPILVQPGTQTPVDQQRLQELKKTDPGRYVATMQAIQRSEPQGQQDATGGPDADAYLYYKPTGSSFSGRCFQAASRLSSVASVWRKISAVVMTAWPQGVAR
jgi:hypothetical protein